MGVSLPQNLMSKIHLEMQRNPFFLKNKIASKFLQDQKGIKGKNNDPIWSYKKFLQDQICMKGENNHPRVIKYHFYLRGLLLTTYFRKSNYCG